MEHRTSTSTVRAWLYSLRVPVVLYPAILLGLQMLLAIALTWTARGTLDPAAADTRLLDFDPKAITGLRIEGAGERLGLTRGDRGWVIASLDDFPADATKVEQLLDRLAGLRRPLPVATSTEAQKRHKVADDGFERKVTLAAGDQTIATLLLGDSPGFKRQFARPVGDQAVYDLDLPLFEVSNRVDDWLVHDRLRVDQTQLTGIATADWKITKNKETWQLEGSTDKPDPAAVINLVGRLGNLGYRGVLGTEDRPDYNQATPALDLTLQLADGSQRAYRISKAKDSQDYVLKAADQPWYFKLSEFDLEGLLDLNRDKLLGKTPAPVPASASPAAEAASAEDGSAPAASPPTPPQTRENAIQSDEH